MNPGRVEALGRAPLRCPACHEALRLRQRQRAMACPSGHTFDVARHGYVNLAGGGAGRPPAGDTAELVADRVAFLAAGHFRPLTEHHTGTARELLPAAGLAVDVGGGTGHYLAHVLDRSPAAHGVLLDSSVPALRRAARAHPRLAAVGCDVWQPWPVLSGSVDLLVNVFAPRNAAEFHRVLRPAGALVVVTPTPDHLAELRRVAPILGVDARKPDRLRDAVRTRFTEVGRAEVAFAARLPRTDARRAVGMGPSAHHGVPLTWADGEGDSGAALGVTVSVVLAVYRPT